MPEHTPAPTPSRAVYGFVLQLSFKLIFVMYILWALIPEVWFESVGITYLPPRYWAIAVPIFLLTVLATFAFVIYPSLGLIMTPSPEDIRTVYDKHSLSDTNTTLNKIFNYDNGDSENTCCKDSDKCGKAWYDLQDKEKFYEQCIPKLQDLDVISVSRHLYGNKY